VDGSFSSIILQFGPNSTESDGLVVVVGSIGKGLVLVDIFVCVMCIHNNSMGQSHLLIVVLGHDCAGGAHIDLVLKMNVPKVSIIGDRGAEVPVLVRLSTCCVEELSFDLGDEMISVGHTANIWGSLEQGSLRLWVLLDGGGSSIRNSNLFPKLTGSTLELLSDGGPVESKSKLV
jgi:hypothetical protein